MMMAPLPPYAAPAPSMMMAAAAPAGYFVPSAQH